VAKIAVDAVLLPAEMMTDKAIEANRRLLEQWTDNIRLNKQDCLPHISLAMGCIEETDIASIGNTLQRVAKSHSPGPLSVIGIRVETNAAGRKISVFEVSKTERLQSLHETVMRELSPYFSYHVTADMVLSEPAADESTLRWIRDYAEKSSFENFFPHITLGYGQLTGSPSPIEFCAAQLALCHLGNHCTCRKVLASAELLIQS
jgi:2'-5' RNA ligase